jgi:hypothetical protein
MRRLLPVVLLLALTGCVSLPDAGPVNNTAAQRATTGQGTFDYNPEAPKSGDEPSAIVAGFLDSLRETPLTFTAARTFLTDAGSRRWTPGRRTIVYADGSLTTRITGNDATVSLGSSVQLDSRGSWLGDPTGGKGLSFDLHLVRQDDQWRISDPPDALIVSRTHFDTRFVRYDLHFFDPAGKVLVPEPVYLPSGLQAPSLLVSGLLAGPDPSLRSVERTFFPVGTRLELPVPVVSGVADVPLSTEILDTDSGQLDLAMAQLAWTLRQVPGIEKMRVTVDGTPVDSGTGASARSLLGWSSYDPAVASAANDLYALKDGEVVSKSAGALSVVSTAFKATPVRSLGVSLGADPDVLLAAVTRDGSRVLSAPASGPEGQPTQVYAGSDILRPAFDRFDQIWLVDRAASGARVVVVSHARTRLLAAPGISGRRVTAFELSRDGTRLAAIVDGKVVMARINRSETGVPTSIRQAADVRLQGQPDGRPVDLAWTTPSTLATLVRLGPNFSQVMLASVDGSFALDTGATRLEPLFERALSLITWPGVDAPVYLRAASGQLYEVSPTGHWAPAALPQGLAAPTFPG